MGPLESWRDGPTKAAILDFVDRVTGTSPDHVAPEERVAVFDNDGTLWCEKPAYIQLDFLIRRFAEQAAQDPSLLDSPPYRAAADGDLEWFGDAMTKHYQGDDSRLMLAAAAITSAHREMPVGEHAARVNAFFAQARHPVLGRPYLSCSYLPMVELLDYLAAHGFTNYIVSGGGRDFMRPITGTVYRIPPERVIGSAVGLRYVESDGKADLVIGDELDVFADGPEKPVRIWNRIGRRPILAAGNSNGDVEMLTYTGSPGRPALRLLVCHDDAEREFAYTAGAEAALRRAAERNWTVVGMKDDWSRVFGD